MYSTAEPAIVIMTVQRGQAGRIKTSFEPPALQAGAAFALVLEEGVA